MTLGMTAQCGVHGAIEASDGSYVFGSVEFIYSYGLPSHRLYQALTQHLIR